MIDFIERKSLAVLMTFVLFSGTASASSISVEPGSFEFNILSGDSFNKTVEFTYQGETSVVADLETDVYTDTENTEGFSASFNRDKAILEPDQPRNFVLSVDTSTGLKPGNYSVEGSATVEIESVDTGSDDDDSDGGFDFDEGFSFSDDEEQSGDIENDSQNRTRLNESRVDDLKNRLEEKNSTVERLREELNTSREEINQLNDTIKELRSDDGDDSGSRDNRIDSVSMLFLEKIVVHVLPVPVPVITLWF